ncbi:OmpA family protein [Paraliomyxa miuraensis]|uniref:OmpA family protein n=1 Tax=Paraliomyxa miuraensis TaxID=376150 RepID=UPI00225567A3|nr:OmpA family protein [Paraliomyxa miuraensis]
MALVPGCLGQKLLGEVEGTQTTLQRAIRDGSKAIHCAPKETAIAEANIKFAQDALAVGEYYRGKQYAEDAAYYTARARELTTPERCRTKAVGVVGDRDGDGYDDEVDKCADDPEDFDSFEDDDGCPDPDNDGDQVLDAAQLVDGQWVNDDKKGDRDCRNEPEDMDGFEDEDGCPDPDNDADGILDEKDACKNEPEDVDNFQDEDGCPEPDNDGDKICDPWVEGSTNAAKYADVCKAKDKCPDDPEDYDGDQDEDGCPDLKAQFDGCSVKISDKVFFKFNKWDIDPRSFELLDDVATVMNQVPKELHFRIEGHTDSKGSNKSNLKLSQRRTDSVKKYLVAKGVEPERLEGVGYGEERPIDSNRTAEGRANNRRVEFNVSNADCKPKTP